MKIDISKFLAKVGEDNKEDLEKAERSVGMLQTMNRVGYNAYAGTVPPATVQKRRNRNKMARQSRRNNRGR